MEIICYSCGRGEFPENTLEGIRHCQSVNPDWRIEMDIQLTQDGQLVLFHDYTTKRVTGVDARIDKLTLKEAQQLNVGYHFIQHDEFIYRDHPIHMPTVEDVFRLFPKAKLMLDLHTNNLEAIDKLIDLIEPFSMANQVIIVSHYDKVIQAFRAKRPEWTFGVPTNEAKKMIYGSYLYLDSLFPIRSDILMLPQKAGKINVLTKRVVQHAKKRNKKLWVWMYEGEYVKNVDYKDELEEMQALGADGVFTDYPSRLMKEMQ